MLHIKLDIQQNRTPWEITLEKRIHILHKALEQGKRIALLIYEQADTSTFRYRGYNIMQQTLQSSKWQSVYFFMNEVSTILDLLEIIHLVVIIRVKWVHNLDQIVSRAKANGKKVLFDVDDMVFSIDHLNVVTNTLNVHFGSERDYEFWFAYISRIGFSASKADGFVTTNHFLGEQLEKTFKKPYRIIKNALNQEQLDVSAAFAKDKARQLARKRRAYEHFTIGYFSGTPSHINDFREAAPELALLLDKYPDMHLKVVGFMEFPSLMEAAIHRGQVFYTPLVDFLELQRLTAEVDVNIVPLVENTFTNCKSELKFFEAAIVYTPTIATPIYTYANCIKDGVNGFLCRPGQWFKTIEKVYNKEVDIPTIIQRAHEYAIQEYSGNVFTKQIEESYDAFYNS